MKTIELAHEGAWTPDGRLLEPGSVTWRNEVPLLMRREDQHSDFTMEPIGFITNIRRWGSCIIGDTNLDWVEAVMINVDQVGMSGDNLGLVFTDARIMSAVVCTYDEYLWKDSIHDDTP